MASILDVFGRLLLEDGGRKFVADAKAAGAKAGDAAGQSMGQRVSAGLKGALGGGLRVAAAGAALAFGVAAKGALELENATARYRAETGATAEEAARAGKIINETAGRQRASLEAVTEVAIKVRRDLGAIGPEADKLTEAFTRFGRVTRQDAAGAVADFDDILDAWGLTAGDAQVVMDKLLVSQQKYGGSITANQKALAGLAPQLQALGAGIDDGIGLLNLFAASGIDASKASAALNKAIAKLKPGQDLDDLVQQISAIEDPTERAQKAIEIFGARGGAALANALKPGIGSLQDFAISQEEATGATERAADVLDNTFSARIQRAISETGAKLRQLGADMGPLLTGTAALASLGGSLGLDKVLGKALGKLAGSALVKGAASKAGFFIGTVMSGAMFVGDKLGNAVGGALSALPGSGAVKKGLGKLGSFMGTGLGKALGVAFAAVAVLEVVNTYNQVKAGLAEQTAQIGDDIANQIKTGTDAQLQQSKAAIETGLKELEGVWDFGLFTGDTRAQLQAQLDAINAEAERRAKGLPPLVADALAAGSDEVGDGADDMVDGVDDAVEAAIAAAAEEAAKGPIEIAAGLRDKRGSIDAAMAQLATDIENASKPTQESAKLVGLLLGEELSKGLASADPIVKAQAEGTKELILGRLRELIASKGYGRDATAALAAGLASKDEDVRTAAQELQGIVNGEIGKLPGNTRTAGGAAAGSLATGLQAPPGKKAVLDATKTLANIVLGFLRFITGGATNTTLTGGRPNRALAGGGHVAAGEAVIVGDGGVPELWIPDVPGTVVPPGASPHAVAGGGDVTNIYNLTVEAPSPARDPIGLVRELRRTVDAGQWPNAKPTGAPA